MTTAKVESQDLTPRPVGEIILGKFFRGGIAAIFERHDQSSQTRTEVAIGGQRSSVVLLLRRRVENVPLELSILWLDFDVLNDHRSFRAQTRHTLRKAI